MSPSARTADTFTFTRDERCYIHFLAFPSDRFGRFLDYLASVAGLEMGARRDLGLALAADFELGGRAYLAVAGEMDSCHVVAPDEAARRVLIEAAFGRDVDWRRHATA